MTHKHSHMFEKIMYKVKTKSDKEVYRVRDFTSGDNVDASKFIESMSQRGEIQLQTSVCVLYKDEYNSLIQEIEPLKDKVKKLKISLNDKEIKIKKLEDKLEAKIQTSNDEVIQLKEDNFSMTQSHDKEVSKLRQEISRLEKSHLEEINKLKETHANQLLAIDETHKKEIEKIQSHNNAKLDEVNEKMKCSP